MRTAGKAAAHLGRVVAGLIGDDGMEDAEFASSRMPPRYEWLQGRPSIPLILWFALGAWLATAVSFGALRLADRGDCRQCFIVGLLAAAVLCGLLVCRWGSAAIVVLGLGISLGVLCGAACADNMHHLQSELWDATGTWEVVCTQDGRMGSFGESVVGKTVTPSGHAATVRVNLAHEAGLMAGDHLKIHVTWRKPSDAAAESLWDKGVVASAQAASIIHEEESGPGAVLRTMRRSALEQLAGAPAQASSDGAQFLQAVLLGWRGEMFDAAWYTAAKADGLAHMVAVSGAHLAIVCGLGLMALRAARVPRRIQLLFQLLLVGGYLVLTGAPISAIRAAFMVVLGLSAFLVRRRAYSLGALSFAIIAMVVVDPVCARSLSFVLSAGSTLGIVLFARGIERWFALLLSRPHAGVLLQGLSLTLAAQLVTNPLVACEFGQISLIAPFANMLVAPVFSAVCGIGLPLSLLSAATGSAMPGLTLLAQLCGCLCALLQGCAGLPLASVPIDLARPVALLLAIGMPAALWALWPRPTAWCIGICIAIACVMAISLFGIGGGADDEIVMFDVGQGDAFLLRSGGKAMLIDTGNNDRQLLQALARHGVHRLDAVAISHADDDHCGSLGALKGVVGIDRVILARDMLACTDEKAQALVGTAAAVTGNASAVIGVGVGGQISLGRFACRVIGPDSFTDNGGNADSLALLWESDQDADGQVDWRGLFCGDAEKEQLAGYESAGRVGDVDVYKVGHHGSRAAVDEQTAAVLHPEICLVSVGANNRYGHPVPSTLGILEAAGGHIWRTDEQGDVTVHVTKEQLRVSTQR
jgi:competence protein ComEC